MRMGAGRLPAAGEGPVEPQWPGSRHMHSWWRGPGFQSTVWSSDPGSGGPREARAARLVSRTDLAGTVTDRPDRQQSVREPGLPGVPMSGGRWRSMGAASCRRAASLALASVCAAAVLAGLPVGSAAGETLEVRQTPRGVFMKISAWQVSFPSHARLAGALEKLGRARLSQKIRTTRGRVRDRASCIADYRRRKASLQFTTLGGLRRGRGGCEARGRVYLSDGIFSARRWRTDRGLRVGQRVSRLRRLYPGVTRVRRPANPRYGRRSYWLVSQISPCCDSRVPVLEAVVAKRRVKRFVLHVGAQGE